MLMEVRHVSKRYGKKTALADVSLKLEKGKLYALCGNNGAGKSTLMRILASVEHVDQGDVLFETHSLSYLDRKEIAYFADESFFSDDVEIEEIFVLYEYFFDDFDRKKCERLVYQNGIDRNSALSSLSKGNRVKLELSFTLSRRAKLYLFDEPFASLDPLAREEVMQMIVSCGSEDATYVIATHLLAEFESYFDQVLFLQDGKLIVDQSVDKILGEKQMGVQDYLKTCLRANG